MCFETTPSFCIHTKPFGTHPHPIETLEVRLNPFGYIFSNLFLPNKTTTIHNYELNTYPFISKTRTAPKLAVDYILSKKEEDSLKSSPQFPAPFKDASKPTLNLASTIPYQLLRNTPHPTCTPKLKGWGEDAQHFKKALGAGFR